MIRGKGLILAMTVAFASACATTGGGSEMAEQDRGNRPRDNSYTNAAGVHLVQASTAEGEQARSHYQLALDNAQEGIQADSANPKPYLQAGQAAIGLERWEDADQYLAQALELYPGYDERIVAEREEAWVTAYNTGAEALQGGDTEMALRYFEGADTIYKGRPEAMLALGSVYMQLGQPSEAADAYRDALGVLSGPPPEGLDDERTAQWSSDRQVAAFNAAQLMSQTGRFAEAAEVLETFLAENSEILDPATELRAQTALAGFLAQAGREEDAEQLYNELFGRDDLSSVDYFQIGIGFFNTEDFARAAEAFRLSAEMNPVSRDALLNVVQARYSQALELEDQEQSAERDAELLDIYDDLLDAAMDVRALDPLNQNLYSFMLRALRTKIELEGEAESQEAQDMAQNLVRTYESQAYWIRDVTVAITQDDRARVTGEIINAAGTEGNDVQIRFSLVDERGNVVEEDVITVTLPAQGNAAAFSTILDAAGGTFAGWVYEIVN